MSLTTTLLNMPTSSPTDVSVYFLDQTKLSLKETGTFPDPNTRKTVWVYADGEAGQVTKVTAQITTLKDGSVRNSIRLETIERTTSTLSDDVIENPVDVTISWNRPTLASSAAVLLRMIGTAYSVAYDGVTAKVPNDGIIEKMDRQVTLDLYS